jgi:N-acetylglucosaminylphosphatidylinositol deacetylase
VSSVVARAVHFRALIDSVSGDGRPTLQQGSHHTHKNHLGSASVMTIQTVHVIVIAHPDDESMFFIPTIRSILRDGSNKNGGCGMVWLLCLTTGNYDGLGEARKQEVIQAAKLLGICNVIVRDDDETGLKDHPRERWDKVKVAGVVRLTLLEEHRILMTTMTKQGNDDLNDNNVDCHYQYVLVTFDSHGISGHVNHIDTYHGVCHLMSTTMDGEIHHEMMKKGNDDDIGSLTTTKGQQHRLRLVGAWQLHSERNLFFKYLPIVSWIRLLVSCILVLITGMPTHGACPTSTPDWCTIDNYNHVDGDDYNATTATTMVAPPRIIICRLSNPTLNWKAMATHQSQFVWYRRLFVVFSCYTYYNILTPLSETGNNHQPPEEEQLQLDFSKRKTS